MKVYFDTEFTGLHKNTTLISIGCVDENGREFYAELSDYDKSQCNEWIEKNVISKLLGQNIGTKDEVAKRLAEWLSSYDSVELVSDVCHYDVVLFNDLFGSAFDVPSNVSPCCHDINQDIANYLDITENEAFNVNRETFAKALALEEFQTDLKHNSLYDAKVIKVIYDNIA